MPTTTTTRRPLADVLAAFTASGTVPSIHPTSCDCADCAAHLAAELEFWNAPIVPTIGNSAGPLHAAEVTGARPVVPGARLDGRTFGGGTARTTDRKANRYAADCIRCGHRVDADAGYLAKTAAGRWAAEHVTCPEAAPARTAQPAPATAAPARTNKYAADCSRCGQSVPAETGSLAKVDGRWVVSHVGDCPAAPVTPAAPVAVDGLDLRPLEAMTSRGIVRLAVPGGDTRLKVRVKFAANGTIYVDDAAVYGEGQFYGSQKPGQPYRGKIAEALTAILADPKAAAIRYAELTERCAVCGRHLEHADSVERGMGPYCWAKVGG